VAARCPRAPFELTSRRACVSTRRRITQRATPICGGPPGACTRACEPAVTVLAWTLFWLAGSSRHSDFYRGPLSYDEHVPVTDELSNALRVLTGRADAEFRPGQAEAIQALVEGQRRVLVVQRTGWGKSAVYFLATHLLRQRGSGPTLLISPLLALMRNQLEAARRLGIRAETVNSTNQDDWASIQQAIASDTVDLLLVSPERFANPDFVTNWLPVLASRTGLLVVDEVHCISDWGHDFRPDYRRIARVLERLPTGVPVLGCTATANQRVVDDVAGQLGEGLLVLRGPLGRDGLSLQVYDVPGAERRLAWLAQHLGEIDGTGIIYCLTVEDTHTVADFLQEHGLAVEAYNSKIDDGKKIELEEALLANRVKALAASTALGMGFDKPDLAFVVHFQSPGSPIAYYQQVGRAGRAIDESLGVLLRGVEDERIQDWFIEQAFPTPDEVDAVLAALAEVDGGLSMQALEPKVNLRRGRLESLLKQLEVSGHIRRVPGIGWVRMPTRWQYPHDRVTAVTAARKNEQEEMRRYAETIGCRMTFIRNLLDDPDPTPCGICDRCSTPAFDTRVDLGLENAASHFLGHRPVLIEPRAQWPSGVHGLSGRIGVDQRLEVGRALSRWGRGPLAELVREGKQVAGHFDDRLVAASAELILGSWSPEPTPTWVTWVPSRRHPALVKDFAVRLADALSIPSVEAVHKVVDTDQQKLMQNSAQQAMNVKDAFAVSLPLPSGPVLLVDDIVDSRWTFTVVGRLLRLAGAPAVFSFALADTAGSSQ
jgi:ATP-dependent DNA helicase RecQ